MPSSSVPMGQTTQPTTIAKPARLPAGHISAPLNAETGKIELPEKRLMYERFVVFFGCLKGPDGELLEVNEHHVIWANEMQDNSKLVLMAPRDHGKTYLSLAYLMWRAWRHNRDPLTCEWLRENPESEFTAMMFSATGDQASEFFTKLKELVVANEDLLFSDIMPLPIQGQSGGLKSQWTSNFVRFRNLARIGLASFGTRKRGHHPNLIICDDVQDDTNSSTKYQRDKAWRYFGGVILPMLGPGGQIIVIGTAQHYNDLLHRLRPTKKNPTGFAWLKYRAVDWDTGEVLWDGRHDLEDLKQKQRFDTTLFSREFLNDPRDDASSLFPHELLQKALSAGSTLTFARTPVSKPAGTMHVLSADMAMSENVGADYCVVMVAQYDLATQKRQVLYAVRDRGWSFDTQVQTIRALSGMYQIDLGVIENNSFQRWVRAELAKYPETATTIVGHQTGAEKQSLQDGVPSLIIGLQNGLWIFPTGGDPILDPMAAQAQEFARIWVSEMNSFGWLNDKLQGVGEHDDTVMATWLLDRACRIVSTLTQTGPPQRYVSLNDLGLNRVKIGDY